MGAAPGVQSFAPTKSGGKQTWMSAQHQTSAPTGFFTYKGTTDTPGGAIQDTHINGQTYIVDQDGKKHATVGSTSRDYHLGDDNSLKAIFDTSTRLLSWARRNRTLHKAYLARVNDMLGVPASERARQFYETSWGDVLDLSNPDHLISYAKIAEIHRSKNLTMLKELEQQFEPTGSESESEVDYEALDFQEIGLDENTQDFMEQ